MSGPTPAKGIPVYAPNRIPAFRGVYVIESGEKPGGEGADEDTAGARKLSVLYTRQELLIPQTWSSRSCGAWRLFQIPDYETFTLCYRNERGFFLFFFFPEFQEPDYWCGFTDPFIERFLFLSNFVSSQADVPFPAILQVRK